MGHCEKNRDAGLESVQHFLAVCHMPGTEQSTSRFDICCCSCDYLRVRHTGFSQYSMVVCLLAFTSSPVLSHIQKVVVNAIAAVAPVHAPGRQAAEVYHEVA